ncbi:MAG: 5-formyltetrahydrofolate cyclo-ligase [Candidatus Gastranaerophilales bacterium]|nr:5-formyltetrahydrofolate cyclo-ligase [Candidatus Gastranaerophilales bacterium]
MEKTVLEGTDLEKEVLRRKVLARRESLSMEERAKAAILLTEGIVGHQWFYRAKYFLSFVSYGSEIDTHPLLEEALRLGKQVYVPKVTGADMQFYRIFSMDELRPGYRGIPEPKGDTEIFNCLSCMERGEMDRVLMLMPGVAFDPLRNRIGYGKGYYDRYLNRWEALQQHTIAVGFDCQLVERVPAEDFDKKPCQVILQGNLQNRRIYE